MSPSGLVEALCLALEKGWGHGYIQIGPSVCTSIKEIAETVVKISGKDIKIVYDTTKPEGKAGKSSSSFKGTTSKEFWRVKGKLQAVPTYINPFTRSFPAFRTELNTWVLIRKGDRDSLLYFDVS